MVLKTTNLYHPFKESYLGIFMHKEYSNGNATGYVLENIDLYYQPVEDPVIGIVFITIRVLMLILAEFIHIKLFKMAKKENGLVKDVTQLYSLTLMIGCPIWVFFITITDWINPVNEVIGQWFCTIGWISTFLAWNIISFHSFTTAMMRYVFIVHEEKVKTYGKEKARRIFLFLSFFVPLIVVIWSAIAHTELDVMAYVNKCYGNGHKVFLIDTSSVQITKRTFCGFENYAGTGLISTIIAKLRQVSCILTAVVMILMGCCISEGIIYYKIFSHMYRYNATLLY
jgi:hypothetical protein